MYAAKVSLWDQTVLLDQDVRLMLEEQYRDIVPVQIRSYFAGWLEMKLLPLSNFQHDYDHQISLNFLNEFVQELENCAQQDPENPITDLFCETARELRTKYTHNPSYFYMKLSMCLQNELSHVNSSQLPVTENMLINHKLSQINEKIAMNERSLLDHRQLIDNNMAYINACPVTGPEPMQLNDRFLADCQNQIDSKRIALVGAVKETTDLLTQVYELVIVQRLGQWKINQVQAGNGAQFDNNLDMIQKWCELLADNIWSTKEQIQMLYKAIYALPMAMVPVLDNLDPVHKELNILLKDLVTNCFIIEKQPPQVMKTKTKFTAKVRLLIGSKLNIYMNTPMVNVSIISELQAGLLVQSPSHCDDAMQSGQISGNQCSLEYQSTTNELSASFQNMHLKKIKRADKKGTECVKDEKFALLFQCTFQICGSLSITVWTLSLPIVVIVHGNQEPQSWATITWDNAFSSPVRIPFQVPDTVPWVRLAEVLKMKFRHATGRGLTEENLEFLREKAFKNQPTNSENPNEMLISWSQFCKEPLQGRKHTFWEWFYAAMKLTRDHLGDPWMEGLVMGFVETERAENLLASSLKEGTFLLRFSDSMLGGITIVWLGVEQGQWFLSKLQPFLGKDLAIKSISDHLKDISELKVLYPNRSKEAAFGKFFSASQELPHKSGYVYRKIVTQVEKPRGLPLLDRGQMITPIVLRMLDEALNNSTPSIDMFDLFDIAPMELPDLTSLLPEFLDTQL